MAAIYSNGGNRWNILGFNFTMKEMRYLVYIRYLWSVLVIIYKSLIQPHFDYCSSVWGNLGKVLGASFKNYKTELQGLLRGPTTMFVQFRF